ncbi:MAG: hypothetical protein J4F28_04030 [Nitrosopumilaceae archaeon]|nr:hypothetical protein [Nitrosopumilaceae archaeon]
MERRPDSLAGSGQAPAGSPRGAGPGCDADASAAALGNARRVPIGIAAVDDMLGGGIPPGIIVDVFGGHGTGKTQIMMQAAARFAACGKRVLFVDTAGTFRPVRVLQMVGASASREAILGMISVARVQNVAEQEGVVARLLQQQPPRHGPAEFDLVAVDSLTDLFSYEYSRYGDLRERNRLFFGYMRSLARLAVHRGVTVMTSNVVRTSGDAEVENMAAEIDMFAHVRIRLAREEVDSSAAAAATRAAGKVLYGYASCVMLDSPYRNGGGGGRDGRHNNRDDNSRDDNYDDNNDGRAHAGDYGPARDHKRSGGGGENYGVKFSYRIKSGGIMTSGYNSDPSRSGINLP